MNDQQQQQQCNKVPRGGKCPQIVAATILSCGMGGFNCATGGEQPQCYIRCCRIDFDESGPLCCMPCTCCYCCCLWPWYAYLVHKALGVDFFNKRFFGDESSSDSSSDDSSSSYSDSSVPNNIKASVTENKTTIMDRG